MLKRYLKWTFYSLLIGILAGVSSTLFLKTLKWATDYREVNEWIILGLPLIGLLIGLSYHYFGKEIEKGNNLILDEIHEPNKIISFKMAPFIFIGTILTHLFGGSAGREGTAVQMGASLADQLSKFFKITKEERKILLVCGVGAGFGSAIGAPLAGVIFGMEVIRVGRLKISYFFESIIASYSAYLVATLLKAPHTFYPKLVIDEWSVSLFFWVIVSSLFFGVIAHIFMRFTHLIEAINKKFISYPPLRPLIFGIIIVSLYYLEGSFQFDGLGLDTIVRSMSEEVGFNLPILKTFFTALTIGSGFKGGEFIPLVFIGATLGSALSMIIPVSFNILASLGFASVFGAAAKTPLACAVMAIEIFGFDIAPLAILSCFVSFYASGKRSIYKRPNL